MLHLPPRVNVIAAKCHVGTSVNKICALVCFFSNKSLPSMMIFATINFSNVSSLSILSKDLR